MRQNPGAPGRMKVTVLLFASLRERVGASRLEREIEAGATAATLIDGLVRDHPALGEAGRFRIAVNSDYTDVDHALRDGDRVRRDDADKKPRKAREGLPAQAATLPVLHFGAARRR